MNATREMLVAAVAVLVAGAVCATAVAGLARSWSMDRSDHRIRLEADQLAVTPAAAATGPLSEALAAGATGNPWNPQTGVRIGPKVDLPPPPPVPLPPPPFLPVPAP
ncbi:MAG: hypothetical protein RLZZ127_868 [Planctomycetota bacterium]|jgi:hypothetical protein